MAKREFPCEQCGALLTFQPGTTSLVCQYCSHENPIPESSEEVREQPFEAHLDFDQVEAAMASAEVSVLHCDGCGAEINLPPNVSASECTFCGSHVVLQGGSRKQIKPLALLPFKVTQERATEAFRGWIRSLWFAPNDLKKRSAADPRIAGVYLPHWTYDANASTRYTGRRGEHYYVSESYTTRDAQGKTVTRTRQVRRTRWYPASGTVRNTFDDILIVASHSLPVTYVRELEPWDLKDLVPYTDEYLSGFRAETYTVGLREGFREAESSKIEPRIRDTVRRDIGGDEQRIYSMQVAYSDISFKHILLPVWMNAYRYKDKTFRFLVNARTGEVQGERPYSAVKITLFILLIALLIAGIIGGIHMYNR